MTISSGIRSGLQSGMRSGINASYSAGFATWSLEKTGGVNASWDAQAYSNETFTGTTVLQFTRAAGNGSCIGLSADNPDANYTGIDFGLLNDNGTMYMNENGVLTSIGATAVNDVWSITRTAGTGAVTFRQNGSLVATAVGTSVAALRVDSSFRFTADIVTTLTVTAGSLQLMTFTTSGVTATGA